MLENILHILKKNKNKVLYKTEKESITYEECYNIVKELSDNLKKQGNSPIILYGEKNINQVVSIIACILAKRCYIPIDVYTPISRIKEIIASSKSNLIIKSEELEIEDIECLDIKTFNNKYKNKKKYILNNNKYAYIIYTSGSTGAPKGVPITYCNLENFINWIINTEETKKCNNINILSQASFSFDLSVMDLYFSIYKNATIISIGSKEKKNLSLMLEIIKKNNINFLIMTPTFIKILLMDENFNQNKFPNITHMFFCGEILEIETVKKIKKYFTNISIINAYGPTEATCCVSLIEITENMLENKLLPVGKISTSATDISILNNEIILKGKSVFEGYLNKNSQSYYKENNINCYKTGDMGYIKEDYLYCSGRIDNQIKYKGYRIELGDIENNLLKIKEIREAVVICKYKEDSNVVRLIKAFITLQNNITEEKIKEKLSKLVPGYMLPKKIVILEKMPINNNGKYDRKKLSEL